MNVYQRFVLWFSSSLVGLMVIFTILGNEFVIAFVISLFIAVLGINYAPR